MRCKHCKDKFTPIHFNAKYCFKAECQKVWLDNAKAKQWVKEKAKRKEKLETVQELMKKAQKVFNTWIRKRDAGLNCISCPTVLGTPNEQARLVDMMIFKQITYDVKFDAGHYFSSGGHKNVTFNEDNVHGQCVRCNRYKHGNLIEYQIGIEKRIGGERLILLHEQAHKTRKYTREEIKDIITRYKC